MPYRPRGRILTLTKDVIEEVAKRVAACASLRDGFLLSGLAESSGFRWLQKGEQDAAAGQESIEREFWEAIANAKARRRLSLKLEVLKAARGSNGKPGDYKAAIALGSITDPKEFVPQINIHVTSELLGAAERVKAAFSDDPVGLEKAIRAMAGTSTEPEEPDEVE